MNLREHEQPAMGTSPTRVHKFVIFGWVMLFACMLGITAMATLVVVFASVVIGKVRSLGSAEPDA